MSLDSFYNAFRVLCPLPTVEEDDADLKYARHQIIRFLSSLGHCEFDFEKRRVYACRPTLVSLPPRGRGKAVLTGARTPALIEATRAFVNDNKDLVSVYETRQTVRSSFLGRGHVSGLELPISIVYESTKLDPLERLAETAGISPMLGTPAAWSLVTFSASLAEMKGLLDFERFRDLNWPRRVFNLETLTFNRASAELPTNGLIEYKNPRDNQLRHILREGDREAVVGDRDWGRYLVLAENELQVLFYFDRLKQLIVPSTVPLPRLLARAATLCSGVTPFQKRLAGALDISLPQRTYVDVYRDVPYAIARRLAEKVSQSLTRLDERYLEAAN
jgi:hypothetical protein